MTSILVLHLGDGDETRSVRFLGREVELIRLGCGGDGTRARQLIRHHDGEVDAIGLEGMPCHLELGPARRRHDAGEALRQVASTTPVVDGSGVRAGLERWGVILADRAQPGIFSQKRVLMVPGLNHGGLATSLARHTPKLRFADPLLFFSLPDLPGVGQRWNLSRAAGPTLDLLREAPFERLAPDGAGGGPPGAHHPFRWADVLAGDVAAIRRFAPPELAHKTIVVETASDEDLEDLRRRGAAIAVTLMPPLDGEDGLGRWSAAVIEALLVALREHPDHSLTEDTYLNLMADLAWQPAVRYLQPEEAGINRFAFAIHPLDISYIHKHPPFWWTRFLPDELVERVAAWMPPMWVGSIRGAVSPATGQRVAGELYSLGATPRQMVGHSDRFTYDRLVQAARMAERRGARIMGLGAFTSVVGDAGVTVAREASIAITSGNSLTVAATLEAAKQAMVKMGARDLSRGKAMVIGATGSIGSVCARLLAQAIRDVVLISIEPEKLIELKRTIEAETPGARVAIATRAEGLVADCDLIVTATSAFGQRIMNIAYCKPGAVICDVARPSDINEAEAATRPDVLVIESGEVLLPGDPEVGYNIGLPGKTVYACLAETALLAMEGRFECYTLGRQLDIDRVKEIYRLYKKHGFQIDGLRSFDRYVSDEELAEKRRLAEALRRDPDLLARVQTEAAARIAELPVMAKGVRSGSGPSAKTLAWAAGGALLAGLILTRRRRRRVRVRRR